jgi:alpha-L-fucosidase 2
MTEREPGHRHISHVYALFPGWQITSRGTPELAEAARQTIAFRLSGGGTTRPTNVSNSSNVGWSLAWNSALWARLGNGAQAHQTLTFLLQRAVFANLFDGHPPGVFQIDGNLGGTATVAEMLLQSHAGEIELLPALPAAWPEGRVRGLRARGGYEVDLDWHASRLSRITVRSSFGGVLRVRYGEKTVEQPTRRGQALSLGPTLQLLSAP